LLERAWVAYSRNKDGEAAQMSPFWTAKGQSERGINMNSVPAFGFDPIEILS
jgi:hypothetical protein